MRATSLPRLYSALSPEERLQLVLAARARGDRTEADRLERACPRRQYTMPEAEYSDSRDAVQLLGLAVCADLGRPLAKLEVADAFGWAAGELRERALDAAEAAAVRLRSGAADQGDLDLAEDWHGASAALVDGALGPLEGAADAIARDLAAEIRAIWDGFGRFCRSELGLEPETVLGAVGAPVLARLESRRAQIEAAEPEPAAADEYARMLRDAWWRAAG